MVDSHTTPKKKLLIMVAHDLAYVDPLKLGRQVAFGLNAGMDVDVRRSDGKIQGKSFDAIFIDEVVHV